MTVFRFLMGIALAFALSVSCAACADEAKPLLHNRALPVLATPTFTEALDASWSVAKGKWTPHDGVLDVLDVAEEKHIPVLHHKVGLASATIDVEFMIDGVGSFLVGCDSDKHVVPGHDPLVMARYPAVSKELEGIAVRLDVAPKDY